MVTTIVFCCDPRFTVTRCEPDGSSAPTTGEGPSERPAATTESHAGRHSRVSLPVAAVGVAEGAAAATFAAAMKLRHELVGKRVALVHSGANLATATLGQILAKEG